MRAPSNIALIKYMGKRDSSLNLPDNASLSMTLNELATWVSIRSGDSGSGLVLDAGLPDGAPSQARAPRLNQAGTDKVLRHAALVRSESERILPAYGMVYTFVPDLALRSCNTFPEASGIASSASSFAAVTLAVALASAGDSQAFALAWLQNADFRRELARVSRRGSGSSCRSFEGPWVRWEGEDARALDLSGLGAARLPELAHFVLLISSEAKAVSSSQAHARVKSSPLWNGRVARVVQRLAAFETALRRADLASLARIAWSEAWEMHSLFHTASEPFTYWKSGTVAALEWLAPYIYVASGTSAPVPPIVTMDAGPNIHITVPVQDAAIWRTRFTDRFGHEAVLEDRPGSGASIVGSS